MATKLTKPVSRRVVIMSDNRIDPRPRDLITVTLYPSSHIGFRIPRGRTEYVVSLQSVYEHAVKNYTENERKAKTKRG